MFQESEAVADESAEETIEIRHDADGTSVRLDDVTPWELAALVILVVACALFLLTRGSRLGPK